jgi:hypothetical protein
MRLRGNCNSSGDTLVAPLNNSLTLSLAREIFFMRMNMQTIGSFGFRLELIILSTLTLVNNFDVRCEGNTDLRLRRYNGVNLATASGWTWVANRWYKNTLRGNGSFASLRTENTTLGVLALLNGSYTNAFVGTTFIQTWDTNSVLYVSYAYIRDYAKREPSISFGTEEFNSGITSVTATPNTLDMGDTITFSVSWMNNQNLTDLGSLHVCTTNSMAIDNSACAISSWCDNNTGQLQTTPINCSYTTQYSDWIGVKNYYAFICTPSLNCTSSSSGTFTIQDTTNPIINSTSLSNTVRAGSSINISWNQYDFSIINQSIINITNPLGTIYRYFTGSGNMINSLIFNETTRGLGTYSYLIWVNDSTNGLTTTSTGSFIVNLNITSLSNISRVYDESSLEREINETTHDILDNMTLSFIELNNSILVNITSQFNTLNQSIINNLTKFMIELNDSLLLNITSALSNLNLTLQDIQSIIESNNSNIYNEILALQVNITKVINQTDCSLTPLSTLCNYIKDINNSVINANTWSSANVTLTLSRLEWLYNEIGECTYEPDDGVCELLSDIKFETHKIKDRIGVEYLIERNMTLGDLIPRLTSTAQTTLAFVGNLTSNAFNSATATEASTKTINLAVVFIIVGIFAICLIILMKK